MKVKIYSMVSRKQDELHAMRLESVGTKMDRG